MSHQPMRAVAVPAPLRRRGAAGCPALRAGGPGPGKGLGAG
ncbi:hypothetical protein [Lolliginicoccus lacisalsi]|nr:hypothetical protein [Lolliginicoccus lacisalsi]